jgi:hypothetical protein
MGLALILHCTFLRLGRTWALQAQKIVVCLFIQSGAQGHGAFVTFGKQDDT